jgi:hypothetical protein
VIASPADAWRWYESARAVALAMRRLGRRHWASLPWAGPLGRDDRLRNLEASEVLTQAETVLTDLNDLCVLLLFSVFESTVRDRVLTDVAADLPELHHPALLTAVAGMRDAIEHGSFAQVLEPFKRVDADLVEQVSQVRRYRNWVAHGRRGVPTAMVDPPTGYERLQRFLDRMTAAPQ